MIEMKALKTASLWHVDRHKRDRLRRARDQQFLNKRGGIIPFDSKLQTPWELVGERDFWVGVAGEKEWLGAAKNASKDDRNRPRNLIGYKLIWCPEDRLQAIFAGLLCHPEKREILRLLSEVLGGVMRLSMPGVRGYIRPHTDGLRLHFEGCLIKYDPLGNLLPRLPKLDGSGLTARACSALLDGRSPAQVFNRGFSSAALACSMMMATRRFLQPALDRFTEPELEMSMKTADTVMAWIKKNEGQETPANLENDPLLHRHLFPNSQFLQFSGPERRSPKASGVVRALAKAQEVEKPIEQEAKPGHPKSQEIVVRWGVKKKRERDLPERQM